MASPDAILLIVLSLLISVVGFIAVRMYQALFDKVLPAISELSNRIYGQDADGTDDGIVGDISELKDTVEESSERRQEEHKKVGTRLERLQDSLCGVRDNQRQIADSLRQSDSVDLDIDINNDNNSED